MKRCIAFLLTTSVTDPYWWQAEPPKAFYLPHNTITIYARTAVFPKHESYNSWLYTTVAARNHLLKIKSLILSYSVSHLYYNKLPMKTKQLFRSINMLYSPNCWLSCLIIIWWTRLSTGLHLNVCAIMVPMACVNNYSPKCVMLIFIYCSLTFFFSLIFSLSRTHTPHLLLRLSERFNIFNHLGAAVPVCHQLFYNACLSETGPSPPAAPQTPCIYLHQPWVMKGSRFDSSLRLNHQP